MKHGDSTVSPAMSSWFTRNIYSGSCWDRLLLETNASFGSAGPSRCLDVEHVTAAQESQEGVANVPGGLSSSEVQKAFRQHSRARTHPV